MNHENENIIKDVYHYAKTMNNINVLMIDNNNKIMSELN